jgi:hypothetical protein
MPLDSYLEIATPAEVVALARLAESPDIVPPPHLRSDLEAKGWVDLSDTGIYLLTSEGRNFLDQFA